MILTCRCLHRFQDQIHGPRMRVHNETKEGKGRCTVCKNEREKKG